MSASDVPASPRAVPGFWPAPADMRARTRTWLAPGAVLPVVLDLARGVAALAVLAFHLRSWLMVPYADATPHGPGLAAFYLATGFGHEAVIVFFVLSGFLIGGAVLRLDFAAPGAVLAYGAARLARIGPVLLGAVGLAVVARAATASWTAAPACHDTLGTVLGNLLALGNLGVPVLCNDMPLWSLSNEIAYYIAFPTLVALGRGRASPGVLMGCGAVLAICLAALTLTPRDQQNVVLYCPAWMAGAALWWLPTRRTWPVWPGVAALAVALAASRLPGAERLFLLRDMATTVAFAALLAGLVGRPWPAAGGLASLGRPVAAVASGLAAISFSLYVTHNPVIDVTTRWLAYRGAVFPLATLSWPLWLGLAGACLGVALTFAQVFERPHRAVARWLQDVLARPVGRA